MRRVANHHHLGEAATHLEDGVPHRRIAVLAIAKVGITAVNQADVLLRNTLVDKAVYGTCPQTDVGRHRVLHQYGNILIVVQSLGNLLNGEWRYGCARANPQNINAILQRQLNVCLVGHLYSDGQTCLLLNLLQPHQRGLANTLECSGVCAGLPYASANDINSARTGQLHSSSYGLLARLGATRT